MLIPSLRYSYFTIGTDKGRPRPPAPVSTENPSYPLVTTGTATHVILDDTRATISIIRIRSHFGTSKQVLHLPRPCLPY